MSAETRTARLVDARRLSAAHKRRHTLHTIDAVRRRGDRITFAGIAREAAVSSWFVRNQPEVRAAIDRAMRDYDLAGTPDKRTRQADNSTVGLRSELLLAREEIQDLRRERDQMRQHLRIGLGDLLEHSSRADLLQRVAELERRNEELLAGRAEARASAAETVTQLSELNTDLAAARAANRRFMRDANVG